MITTRSGKFDGHPGLFRSLPALLLVALLGLSGCAAQESAYPDTSSSGNTGKNNPSPDQNAPREGLFGQNGLKLFGGNTENNKNGGSIGVNAYLWRATLDTLAFAPLASADPFGGVVITDWYADPATPDERFKMTGYILDKRLRADGVKVTLFRQIRQNGGNWEDATVDPGTPVQLENAILVRARQLRIDSLEGGDG